MLAVAGDLRFPAQQGTGGYRIGHAEFAQHLAALSGAVITDEEPFDDSAGAVIAVAEGRLERDRANVARVVIR